jgi:hypothetical protein
MDFEMVFIPDSWVVTESSAGTLDCVSKVGVEARTEGPADSTHPIKVCEATAG